jgi:imidazolonepropionase-like amidohydrolase
MVEAGMSPEDTIVAATSSAAKLLALDDRIGSIEPGKLADIVVVKRNPIEDITALQTDFGLVMRDGVVYRDELEA